jgi:S1 RNA binding domain protein
MSIEVGAKVQGKVTQVKNFGAFVDLGDGKSGLVHISEVANGFVKDINDVVHPGDEVTVIVTEVSPDGKKIGLSIRKALKETEGNEPARGRKAPRKENGEAQNHPKRNPTHTKKDFHNGGKQDFDSLMSSFLKNSEERLTSLKRNTEGKRGGRGGRRK